MKTARKGRQSAYISIRSKLVAAVAMLLVASFMVVSSSYAWFTLSTAPEVKGITTTVGSNGNLEIALYTGGTVAQSGIGDAGKNETWGNLIDLTTEGNTTYGLSLINLYPTRLNVDNDNSVIKQASPLKIPKYAADGRVEKLEETTLFGTYNTKQGQFMTYDANNATDGGNVVQTEKGVRAIGSSTGLTPQQNDYRIAKNAITDARNSIATYANLSLDEVGSNLASIAVDRALNGGTDTDTYDASSVGPMLQYLNMAVEQIDSMVLSYIKTQVAKANQGAEADAYATVKAPFYAETVTDDQLTTWVATYKDDDEKLLNVWEYRNAIKNAVDTSSEKYTALGENKTQVTWTQLQGVLNGLVDLNSVTVNNMTLDELKKKDPETNEYIHMGDIIASISSGLSIALTPPANATTIAMNGVYINIANLSSNVSATISVNVMGYPMTAKMVTKVSPTPALTTDLTTVIPAEPVKGESTAAAILDSLYGYVIDLAFRTNAAGSNLKLQSTPINRIYSGDTNEATMGMGSFMTFFYSSKFNADRVKNLMKSIRVVFASDTGAIYAVGGLNTDEAEVLTEKSAVYAPIGLYEATSYDWTENGFTVVGANGLSFVSEDNAVITALDQNQTERLCVYVYLDGDSVENSSVAASGDVRGILNLQFSSDAGLVPMDYNPLKTPATTETPATPETPAQTEQTGGQG